MIDLKLEFDSYLDAWNYARKHGIKRKPKRINFRKWSL